MEKRQKPSPGAVGARLVVSYVGGDWTDKLAIGDYGLDDGGDSLMLTLEVGVRARNAGNGGPAALRELVRKRQRIEFIRIGKPAFVELLRRHTRMADNASLGVRLRAKGHEVLYPAAVVFGPDAITLHLG
jgi:hypothetical protein